MIKAVDSDVIKMVAAAFYKTRGLAELWVDFGLGKSLRFIPVNEITSGVRKAKSNAVTKVAACFTQSVAAIQIHLLQDQGKCLLQYI